jgi:hypothetical protein
MLERCGGKKSSNAAKAHLTHIGCMDLQLDAFSIINSCYVLVQMASVEQLYCVQPVSKNETKKQIIEDL